MNIQRRFRYFVIPIAILSILLTFVSVRSVISNIVRDWTSDAIHHEANFMFDKSIAPIEREIALAKTIVSDPLISDWAQNPDNPQKQRAALDFLNQKKSLFQSKSYFVALKANLHYYHNNAIDEFTFSEHRYTLVTSNSDDAWFFSLINNIGEQNLNVDRDRGLNIVQLWINLPIRVDGETIGLIGTGFELNNFISNKITSFDDNYSVVMIDSSGAIQLDNDQDNITFGSAGKLDNDKRKIFKSLNQKGENNLRLALKTAMEQPSVMPVIEVFRHGVREFVGVSYIPLIDWYQLIFVDINKALPESDFTSIYLIIFATPLLVILVLSYGLRRYVINPVKQLQRSTDDFAYERKIVRYQKARTREFRELENAFLSMANQIQSHERTLKDKITQRTQDLIQAEKLSSLGSIAAGVAHEINNPLGFMRSNLEIIEDYVKELEPTVRALPASENGHDSGQLNYIIDDLSDALTDSIKGCERISHIVNGLRQYSLQEKGLIESISLNHIATMAIEVCLQEMQQNTNFSYTFDEPMPLFDIDPKALTNILVSMLKNAAEAVASSDKKDVVLSTFANNKTIGVIIEDTGIGITEDNIPKLFTPFYTTKPIGKGLGLNLAVAMATVKSFDGSIEVQSQHGTGTQFKISFPRQ